VCFPLFPVVDWRNFLRTYYDTDEHRIHQKGMQWMFRGLVHLILYRLVYYRFTLPMEQVANVGDLARFLVANYLLYLRISGQFHLIVGMLGLFGFNLPETNRLYLLASGFSDYWRRINIAGRTSGEVFLPRPSASASHPTRGLVPATAYVFAVTWALHLTSGSGWVARLGHRTGHRLLALLGSSCPEHAAGGESRRRVARHGVDARESFVLGRARRPCLPDLHPVVLWTSGAHELKALWIVGEPGWTGPGSCWPRRGCRVGRSPLLRRPVGKPRVGRPGPGAPSR
jgi:hypothetical protein